MNAPPTLETAIVTRLVRLGSAHSARRRSLTLGFALADVVLAVIALHRQEELGNCAHCSGESPVPWPCDTIKIVAGALGLKDGDWR